MIACTYHEAARALTRVLTCSVDTAVEASKCGTLPDCCLIPPPQRWSVLARSVRFPHKSAAPHCDHKERQSQGSCCVNHEDVNGGSHDTWYVS